MSEFAKSFMKKSPLLHWVGKHPGKDGHVRSDHKDRKEAKRKASDIEFEEKLLILSANYRTLRRV